MSQKETLGFQTEVKQLLHLMIHSLYSNKEIFLRELVSNASDAADKLRFEAIADPALFEQDSDLRIRLSFDKDARTLTIADNGIGMSREEVIEHIGTIAKSGTRAFFEKLSDRSGIKLIDFDNFNNNSFTPFSTSSVCSNALIKASALY